MPVTLTVPTTKIKSRGVRRRSSATSSTSRPMAVEREATHRAITLAEIADTALLIVHVSGREAADEIRRAKQRGLNISAETCPQYLLLTEADLDLPGFEGAKCMCSPPPRDKASQAVLWQGLGDGLFDILSSDHAPYRFDTQGKKLHGLQAPFRKVAIIRIPKQEFDGDRQREFGENL